MAQEPNSPAALSFTRIKGLLSIAASAFVGGPKSIKVTYTGGYLTGDGVGAPDDLRLAAIMQTKIIFDRREDFGLSGRSLEGGSVSLFTPTILPTRSR